MQRDRRAEDALLRLGALHPKRIDLGLERVLNLLEKLGNPHQALPPIIHIAGTNGKGSVIAFLRAMCATAGWRAHAYTSPHLVRFHERIRLNGKLIDDDALADLLDEVEARNAGAEATFFEVTTAAAFLAFSRVEADVVLLETGLGGRADATNVISTPRISIITPIAHDHEHFLGDNLMAIAGEKAGIIKAGIPTLSALQDPEVSHVLREKAAAMDSPFYQLGTDIAFHKKTDGGFTLKYGDEILDAPPPALLGAHQVENAALGAAALLLGFPDMPRQAILDGIGAAVWQARIQRLNHGVLCAATDAPIWLDGAHNRHGAAALAASLRHLHQGNRSKWILIAGALNTRPPSDFLAELKPLIHHLIAVPIPDQEASLTPEELTAAATAIGINATNADSITAALGITRQYDRTMPIIIGGSLYLAGHVLMLNGTPPD